MKSCFLLFTFIFTCFGKSAFSQKPGMDLLQNEKINPPENDSLLKVIIANASIPDTKQAKYISDFTKYGFRNLFSDLKYTPTLPYSGQVNPNTEWFMRDYIRKYENHLVSLREKSLPYFNFIDNILSQYGLPRELKYLAVIESDLKTSATSRVGAAGPWQFMPNTARTFGLMVNRQFDERRDYQKSTHAAARLLLKLYEEMQDWLLVIAAYNGGPERVKFAIQKSNSRNFWVLQRFLPEESRNHVKKFIATHYVMEGAGSFPADFSANRRKKISAEELANSDSLLISGKFISSIVAERIDMSQEDFLRFNPGMDDALVSEGKYQILLPKVEMNKFIAEKYSILEECVNRILNSNDVKPVKTVKPVMEKKKKS